MNSKSILITGCSTGIGYATATILKKRGHRVFAAARQVADVETLSAQGFESVLIDYQDTNSITQGLAWVLDKTNGSLDALFNNGAYGQPGAVEDLPLEALRIQFETNVFGWHELTRQVIPVMRQQGQGRIIQNSSILGLVALKYRGAYNASKYAIEGLSDTLRLELAGSGIHVCLVEPGPIQSEFRNNATKRFHEFIRSKESVHQQAYEAGIAKRDPSGQAPFTLGPEAVVKKVIHALESNKPKAHYYVTFPTYLFAYLKRILPAKALDKLLAKVG